MQFYERQNYEQDLLFMPIKHHRYQNILTGTDFE